ILGGDYKYGRVDAPRPHVPEDLKAVYLGYHEIEQHDAVCVRLQHVQALLSVEGDRNRIAFFLESLADEIDDLGFVFYDQYIHSRTYYSTKARGEQTA